MKRMVTSLRTGLIGLVLIALVPATAIVLATGVAAERERDVLLLVGLIGASLLAAWLWTRYAILGPLGAIIEAAQRLTRGELSARSGIEVGGEFGDLACTFDELAATLEVRDAEASNASAELRSTNQTLQAILTSSPLGIIAVDRQGRLLLWTPAAERMFGWRSDEVLGRHMPWVPEEKQEESLDYMRRTGMGERLSGVRLRRRCKDGRSIDLRAFTAPLRRPDGTIYGTMALLEDVTERMALEDQLHRSQKMQAVGRLAGGLAHDFNNLLTVIRGYSELALRKTGAQAPTRAPLVEIQKAALRANTLIRQLLTFSRQPLGEPKTIDLNRTVAETASLLRPLIGETVTLILEPGEDAGTIHADVGQFTQILTNLVVNARDAMPHGGEIRIRTRRLRIGSVRARGVPDLAPGEYCQLSVSDNGKGMDAETMQHVFEPFFSTKDLSEGAGLGLSTVYGIVAQARGDVRVESEVGRGSTFHVYLPRVVPGSELAPGPAPREVPARGSGTLLVVEDEDEVRAVLTETLESAGYTVLQAASADQAVDRCASHAGPIDLLLTDVVMPGQSGPELAGRLIVQRPGMRVLFISGYAPAAADAALQAFPGTGFVAKPFELESLTRKVHELLSAPNQDARAA
jgi:PAS domain S-box-containing protein